MNISVRDKAIFRPNHALIKKGLATLIVQSARRPVILWGKTGLRSGLITGYFPVFGDVLALACNKCRPLHCLQIEQPVGRNFCSQLGQQALTTGNIHEDRRCHAFHPIKLIKQGVGQLALGVVR